MKAIKFLLRWVAYTAAVFAAVVAVNYFAPWSFFAPLMGWDTIHFVPPIPIPGMPLAIESISVLLFLGVLSIPVFGFLLASGRFRLLGGGENG